MANEEQTEELDALKSIYDGDENITYLSDTVFQYLYGVKDSPKSFLLQISWPEEYPAVLPQITMDLFYNSHVVEEVKTAVVKMATEEGESLSGMAMTFTLIEKVKEEMDNILQMQPDNVIVNTGAVVSSDDDDDVVQDGKQGITERSTQMTKAQKRRMWDKGNANEGRARGWDWVCIIRHLSQTGGQTASQNP